MARTPDEQARDFIAANDRRPVIAGRALEEDPNRPAKGCIYTLADRSTHRLGTAACKLLPAGYPKWRLD